MIKLTVRAVASSKANRVTPGDQRSSVGRPPQNKSKAIKKTSQNQQETTLRSELQESLTLFYLRASPTKKLKPQADTLPLITIQENGTQDVVSNENVCLVFISLKLLIYVKALNY